MVAPHSNYFSAAQPVFSAMAMRHVWFDCLYAAGNCECETKIITKQKTGLKTLLKRLFSFTQFVEVHK